MKLILASPIRKADVVCKFTKFFNDSSSLSNPGWPEVKISIDLDRQFATIACLENGNCPLKEIKSDNFRLTSPADPNDSFVPFRGTSAVLGGYFVAQIHAINLEGYNGDDLKMFVRLDFAAKSATELYAGSVVMLGDEAMSEVSIPTTCRVIAQP